MGAFAVLGWLLGTAVFPASPRRVEHATAAALGDRLPAWTTLPRSVALHGDFGSTPAPWAIDWLAALAHSSHVVTWSGAPPAVAMSASAQPDPLGGVRVTVAAPESALVVIRDDVGVIDSLRISGLGASVAAPLIVGSISATANGQPVGAATPAPLVTRAVVVVGEAGWEGKFIASALEERGWPVIARFSVAPGVDVSQRAVPLVLDTAQVAAVVAVDTSIARLGETVARFVRSGGGLVLAGSSARAASVAPLAPGTVGPRLRPTELPRDTIGLGSTGFYPVAALRDDGVTLERRGGGVAIAARRVGAGRVVQVGYDDSWRWRMAGAAGSEAAHREWWSRVVGSVAYAPDSARGVTTRGASAPLASLADHLGPARSAAPASSRGPVDQGILISFIMLLLLAEWASRRLRGLR